jgi:hypothetical protein
MNRCFYCESRNTSLGKTTATRWSISGRDDLQVWERIRCYDCGAEAKYPLSERVDFSEEAEA